MIMIKVVDARIVAIVYPHGVEGCSSDNVGFVKNMNRVRKSAQKLFALLNILTNVLRGYVPELRFALRKIVLGLRILDGRCVNAAEAAELNVPAGSHPLCEKDLWKAAELLTEGLSYLEGNDIISQPHAHIITLSITLITLLSPSLAGAMPPDSAPPCAHSVLHYPEMTELFARLKAFWLMVFERFNQKIRNRVGNRNYPVSSVINAMKRDSGYVQTVIQLTFATNTTTYHHHHT